MKTALLHYWLTNVRGGEKVLAALGKLFPEADVFTHAYRPDGMDGLLAGHRVTESFIARLPMGRRHPQAYLPLLPMASRALRLDGYDLIVSSESGPIKGIRKPVGARHVCYCHTPMRYLWDMHDDYYRTAGLIGKLAMKVFTGYLRKEDLKSAESVDAFVANSAFVAERIKRIYGRESRVVYPPVDVAFYGQVPPTRKGGYLLAGQLIPYKRPELAVAACMRMGRPLTVIGDGVLRERLARLAADHPAIRFLGRVSDEELRRRYAEAQALLFPGVEDFGIVPVEAQAGGTPVIALGSGGALETVVDGVTGQFFKDDSVDALCGAIEEFESRAWSAEACRANAARFSEERFAAGMREVCRAAGMREGMP